LFNWAVPSRLEVLSAHVAEGEQATGRGPIERWAYVRATAGAEAQGRLAAEAHRYAGAPAYGRAFDAMGVPFEQVGVAGDDLAGRLLPYRRILDGVVVRALPVDWRLDELAEIARSAAGRARENPRD